MSAVFVAHDTRESNGGRSLAAQPRRFVIPSLRGESVVVELDSPEPPWLSPTVASMSELLALEENWNSYGARPVEPAAAALALDLLVRTMSIDTPEPMLTPTNRGGVMLEWHTRGVDMEVEAKAINDVYVYFQDHTRDIEHEHELHDDPRVLRDYLSELARRVSIGGSLVVWRRIDNRRRGVRVWNGSCARSFAGLSRARGRHRQED